MRCVKQRFPAFGVVSVILGRYRRSLVWVHVFRLDIASCASKNVPLYIPIIECKFPFGQI